jgi:hypothetical protein
MKIVADKLRVFYEKFSVIMTSHSGGTKKRPEGLF